MTTWFLPAGRSTRGDWQPEGFGCQLSRAWQVVWEAEWYPQSAASVDWADLTQAWGVPGTGVHFHGGLCTTARRSCTWSSLVCAASKGWCGPRISCDRSAVTSLCCCCIFIVKMMMMMKLSASVSVMSWVLCCWWLCATRVVWLRQSLRETLVVM